MTFPLSKDEMKSISEIQEKLSSQPFFSGPEQQRYKDMISLMEERGVIQRVNTWGRTIYTIVGDMDAFMQWVKAENKKARKLSRREWRIAITAAVIGSAVGLLPTLIRFLLSL